MMPIETNIYRAVKLYANYHNKQGTHLSDLFFVSDAWSFFFFLMPKLHVSLN